MYIYTHTHMYMYTYLYIYIYIYIYTHTHTHSHTHTHTHTHYFHSVFTADDDNCPAFASRTTANMNLPLFKPDDIRAALLASKSSSSYGLDGCPTKILKLFPELSLPLTDIFNTSLKQERIPLTWKQANVIPIFKGNGSKMEIENYRPISLTNVFCKLLESLIRKKMMEFLDSNALLSQSQFGFRQGRSTLSQLFLSKSRLVKSKLFACNYRPISLTCVICKVVETIIRSRILKHCTDNNILNTDQHGFMSNKSTVTNLVEMLNHITAKLDMGSCIDLLCIDFAKAFDSVSHDKLLYKLYAYGIRGNVLNWISGFLKNRTFKVKVNNSFSDIFDVCSSVPQESVLGPLLFLLYVNDITSAVKNSYVKLYADDLSVFRVINNTCDAKLLQNDLDDIYQWANLWQLKINFDKCRCIHFGYSSIHNVYNINNVPIAVSVCERILGVYIDSSLSLSEHVFNIVKKARVTCNLIFDAFHFCDNQVLINLFKVYVRPQLEYASVVFSPRFLYLTDLLENVQRNFTNG